MPKIELEVGVLRRSDIWSGDAVILQVLLARKLYFYVRDIDGLFGPTTEQAVKVFQETQGLDVDGVVGEKTWKALAAGSVGISIPSKEDECQIPVTVAGPRKRLTEEDFLGAAELLNVEAALVHAVCDVESHGGGFIKETDLPVILFEGHIFWQQLKERGIDPEPLAAVHPNIIYRKWTKKHYLGGIKEYDRLQKAWNIDYPAACKSTSWGLFQIMGFNYEICGFDSIQQFVDAMYTSEAIQLEAFCVFLRNTHYDGLSLAAWLRAKNWATFAKAYNGPGYKENNYDILLRSAYIKHGGKNGN